MAFASSDSELEVRSCDGPCDTPSQWRTTKYSTVGYFPINLAVDGAGVLHMVSSNGYAEESHRAPRRFSSATVLAT